VGRRQKWQPCSTAVDRFSEPWLTRLIVLLKLVTGQPKPRWTRCECPQTTLPMRWCQDTSAAHEDVLNDRPQLFLNVRFVSDLTDHFLHAEAAGNQLRANFTSLTNEQFSDTAPAFLLPSHLETRSDKLWTAMKIEFMAFCPRNGDQWNSR
jgi:hypothetical protein